MNTHDQNSSEQVIVLIPTVTFADTIYEAFRGTVQSYLTSVWDNLELWKDVQTQIPEPLHESWTGKYYFESL